MAGNLMLKVFERMIYNLHSRLFVWQLNICCILVLSLIIPFNYCMRIVSTKSAKSKGEPQEDAKSTITDDNNTSAAETTIPLDEDTRKSNGELSAKDGKI